MKLFNFISSIPTIEKNFDFKQKNEIGVLEPEREKQSFKDLLTEITNQNLDSKERTPGEKEVSNKDSDLKNSPIRENSLENFEIIQEKNNNIKNTEKKKEKLEERNNLPIESTQLSEKFININLPKEKSENIVSLNKKTSLRDSQQVIVASDRKKLDQKKLDLNFLKENLITKSSEIHFKKLETFPGDFKTRKVDFINDVSFKKEFANVQNNKFADNSGEGIQKIHIFFNTQLTENLSLKKSLTNKKQNLNIYEEEKRTKQPKNTKEIIQESLKEDLSKKKEDTILTTHSNALEKEIFQTNSKINIAFKNEKNFSEDPKKETELKIQKDNLFKNLIEQNLSNSKILETKENSFKELLTSSIREGLEELIQKAKINIGKDQFSAQIRLNPSIFGFMSLDMKLENQNLIIKILVDNQDVFRKLQENIDVLKNEFAKQGIQIEQLQVKIKETQFFANQDHFQFLNQFSNSESNKKNPYMEEYENSYYTLRSGENIERDGIEELDKLNETKSSYNWHNSKINVWG